MALYDEKIKKYSKKAEQLEQNIRRDTEERKRLLSEVTRLRYLSLCERLNCDGEELETLLAREHGQIQKMKDRGLTDDEIDAIGDGISDAVTKEQEENNENKIF